HRGGKRESRRRCMNVFFGMDVPGANPNDPSFFLRLPHLWPEFAVPTICFYVVLAFWVVRKVRSAMTAKSSTPGGNPPAGPTSRPESQVTHKETTASAPEGEKPSPFDLCFYRCFPLTSR